MTFFFVFYCFVCLLPLILIFCRLFIFAVLVFLINTLTFPCMGSIKLILNFEHHLPFQKLFLQTIPAQHQLVKKMQAIAFSKAVHFNALITAFSCKNCTTTGQSLKTCVSPLHLSLFCHFKNISILHKEL